MISTTPPAAADRFALIIGGLSRAVATQHRVGLSGLLIIAIWSRLIRIATSFAALAARVRAGTLPAPRRRASRPASSRPASSPPAPSGSPPPRPASPFLPRGFAWLIPLVPHEAAGFGSQLAHLLTDPEMTALVSAHPGMGRILRPLCRMLGVATPPALRPARPALAASSSPPPATPPPATISPSEPPAPIPAPASWAVAASSKKSG